MINIRAFKNLATKKFKRFQSLINAVNEKQNGTIIKDIKRVFVLFETTFARPLSEKKNLSSFLWTFYRHNLLNANSHALSKYSNQLRPLPTCIFTSVDARAQIVSVEIFE